MRKRLSRAALFALAIVLVCLWGWCVYRVNAQAIRYPDERHSIGDTVHMEGAFFDTIEERTDGYSVRVDKVETLSYNEYVQNYGIDKTVKRKGLNERSVICVTATISNTSVGEEENGGIDCMGLGIEQSNDLDVYRIDNELWSLAEQNVSENQMFIRIRPQTSYTVHIPFATIFLDENYGDDNQVYRQKVASGMYSLHLSAVPAKKIVQFEL